MPQKTPLHGIKYAKKIVEDLQDLGFTDRQIFENTGLNRSVIAVEKPIVALGKVAALFENAAKLTGNDVFGLQQGVKRGVQRLGLLSYVGTSSPTVEDFIRNIAQYRRVFSDALDMNVDELAKTGNLMWSFRVPSKIIRRQHMEFTAISMIVGLRKITNRELRPLRVEFHHSRNTHLAEVNAAFGCNVQFGCRHNCIQFKRSDLELPLLTADHELYSILVEHCEIVLKRKTRNVSSLVVDVERAITDRLSAGQVTQHTIAKSLGMSPRTLARKLASEETTFFRTVDDLRQSLAEGYLRYSDIALVEIAFLLGYSGLSSFNDAFKRWTGRTPGQFRTV